MLAALTFQFNSARRVVLTLMTIPLIVLGAPLSLSDNRLSLREMAHG
ncbi:hypothetical protein [uncultured Roseobacter sp.]|nr:hypothetical protein [uncultured Roseobacter sp.]